MEEKFEEEVQQEDLSVEELLKEDLPQEETAAEHRYKPGSGRFMISKPTYYALVAIFALVFVLSGIYLGGYFLETDEAEDEYDALASIYQQGVADQQTTAPSTKPVTGPVTTQPPTILPELQPIYELNNDLVGYLSFPNGPSVNYPVMQSPYDEDFYLHHTFYREPNGGVTWAVPMFHCLAMSMNLRIMLSSTAIICRTAVCSAS